MMKLVFGGVVYGVFLVTFLYLIGFVEGLVVPKGLNEGPATPLPLALTINLSLVGLIGVQHSIMARPWFKRWVTQYIPASIERSIFVLVASGGFLLLFWQWRPIAGELWRVETPALAMGLRAISFAGWGLALFATFAINHFDLFGLRQVYLAWRGQPYTAVGFKQPLIYKVVRNPLMLGFLIAFWIGPVMTWSQFLFAAAMTGYVLIGVHFEERDIARQLGASYEAYRARTPKLIPWPRKRGRLEGVAVAMETDSRVAAIQGTEVV